MAWQQLTLHISAEDLPRAESLLELAGAVSITIGDDGDTAILEPEPGTTPLWPGLIVRALFPDLFNLAGIGNVLAQSGLPQAELEQIDELDMAAASTQVVEPIDIGPRLALVAADDDTADGERVLRLHMGLAFGTGRHPTTRLCLEWLERTTIDDARVLDYGCGTGVLALAALKLGASHATAIDNEPQALDATQRNAALNLLDDRIDIGSPDLPLSGSFDLVLANILARPLLDLAERFSTLQTPGANLVLSGLLETQLDDVEQCYSGWYESFERRTLDEWGLLTGVRRNEYDR